MQSVELLLDPLGAERVVGQWDALVAAGLPSQARHRGASNAPHMTIGLAGAIDEGAESALRDLLVRLPLPVHLGPIVLFEGKNSVVLARTVLPSIELLALHAAVSTALQHCPAQVEHLAPGRWVPHVTLAHRMKPAAIHDALVVLRRHETSLTQTQTQTPAPSPSSGTISTRAVALRRWDSEAKRVWTVAATDLFTT